MYLGCRSRSFDKSEKTNYYWTDRENRLYLKFLKDKGDLLTLPILERKKQKINIKLSKFIKTRNATQCHTHHQKMIFKYGTIQNIINQLTQRYQSKKKPKQQSLNEQNKEKNQQQSAQKLEDSDKISEIVLVQQNDLDYVYYEALC